MSVEPRAAEKIVPIARAGECSAAWRTAGEPVVVAEGVFDLLEAVHTRALARARALGGRLIVLLLDDRSSAERLGPGRPLVAAADRASVCAALRVVDRVTIVSESERRSLLAKLRPAWYARGVDPELRPATEHGLSHAPGIASADVGEAQTVDLVARLRQGHS